jgi:dolichol-phosphate mannosyltransferase
MKKYDVSVVVPTYNEKENILKLIPSLESSFKNNKVKGEIIIIDDDSKDETADTARKLNKKYRNIVTIQRKKEKGLASAWFRGYSVAQGDYIATIDADLCHTPKDLMKILRKFPKYDLVIGSRYMKGGSGMQDKSIISILASKLAQTTTRLLLGIKQTDATHSFRVFKKEVFKNIKNQLDVDGNVFQIALLYFALKKNYKVTEVPITYGKREYGETKLNIIKEGLKFFTTLLSLFIKYRVLKKK